MASDRTEGALGPLARLAFDRHLARCAGCAAYVRQLAATRQALGRLPGPAVPEPDAALLARFDAWAAARATSPSTRAAARFSPWPPLAAAAALGLLLAFARHRSQAPDDWLVASALAAAALAVAAAAGRLAAGVVAAAAVAAVAAALLGGGGGALEAAAGLDCLATELAAAALVGAAAWVAARREPGRAVRRWLAAGGVAGALAADAALQVACRAHDALPHLLAFHAGGVLVAAAGAAALLRARAGPVSSGP